MTSAISAAHGYAAQQHFLGTITPSGNTVVERITLGVARWLPSVSTHFSRTPVFGSSDPSPDAYATEGPLAAARLLAHAAPQVLVWNGSKGGTIGFGHDEALARAIHAETGIRTTTSMLGLKALLAARGIERVGIVTPYADAGHRKTIDCFEREGFACVGDANARYTDNLSYATVPLDRIAEMLRHAAVGRPQVLLCLCTNFPAAVMAAPMEAELGIPVYDSTALGAWHGLRLAGVDTSPAAPAWGSLFAQPL